MTSGFTSDWSSAAAASLTPRRLGGGRRLAFINLNVS
jgi:hypothetical protein